MSIFFLFAAIRFRFEGHVLFRPVFRCISNIYSANILSYILDNRGPLKAYLQHSIFLFIVNLGLSDRLKMNSL